MSSLHARPPRGTLRNIDTVAFLASLRSKGYRHLIIQKGTGTYLPRTLVPEGTSNTYPDGLHVEYVSR